MPAVTASIKFRTHYLTQFGQQLAVVGNCNELGNDAVRPERQNVLNWKEGENGIWEKNISIRMRLQDGALTVGKQHQPLEFSLVVCNDNGGIVRERVGSRNVQLNRNDGTNFTIETTWDQPDFRVFSGSDTVKIRIHAEHETHRRGDELRLLGNFDSLEKGVLMNCIRCDENKSIWQTDISLPMNIDDNFLKLHFQNQLKFLQLRLQRKVNGAQVELGRAFDTKLPGIANDDDGRKKFDLHCTFDNGCWVSINMPLEIGLINRDSIFTLLHNNLRVHLPEPVVDFDDVKSTYAQCLVPIIKLDGGYDGRARGTSGAPHTFHDIWGQPPFGEQEECHELPPEPPIVRSAIEYMRLRKAKGLANNKKKICKRLSDKYHQRQQDIGALKHVGEQDFHEGIVQVQPGVKHKNALIKLAHWVRDKYRAPDDFEFLQLFRHSAAIVRGRMEASLVSKKCDVMHSDWYWFWKDHMEVAACWFVVMMAAWTRLGKRKNKNFRDQLKEDGGPFVPNFYRWK